MSTKVEKTKKVLDPYTITIIILGIILLFACSWLGTRKNRIPIVNGDTQDSEIIMYTGKTFGLYTYLGIEWYYDTFLDSNKKVGFLSLSSSGGYDQEIRIHRNKIVYIRSLSGIKPYRVIQFDEEKIVLKRVEN